MKESLIPILFGGSIALHKAKSPNKMEAEQEEGKGDEEEEEEKHLIQYDTGFKYQDVVCGGSQTLAIIDQTPYLMLWGNGNPKAETYSEVFSHDRPIKYASGGIYAIIYTEKGILYKINLENKTMD